MTIRPNQTRLFALLLVLIIYSQSPAITPEVTGFSHSQTIDGRKPIKCGPSARNSRFWIAQGQTKKSLQEELRTNQYDLRTNGRTFLLEQAREVSFFLLGEMHGENEIPAPLRMLWPPMWDNGYRYVAAEVSPWAARRLEFPGKTHPADAGYGLWRRAEADFITGFKKNSEPVLWGCDIEEVRPQVIIAELSLKNPANEPLRTMAELTREGYKRSRADELLALAQRVSKASRLNNESKTLLHLIVETLDVESDRAHEERLRASAKRELIMKRLFIEHYRRARIVPKVLARFGGNHLNRGFDRRGVSTLGNFIAEFALARGESTFHLFTFCAGGRIRLGSAISECDDTKEDPGLALLASQARYPETIFDLRVLRQTLHRIPEGARSPAETSLIYWADSYDAVICYLHVTPLQ